MAFREKKRLRYVRCVLCGRLQLDRNGKVLPVNMHADHEFDVRVQESNGLCQFVWHPPRTFTDEELRATETLVVKILARIRRLFAIGDDAASALGRARSRHEFEALSERYLEEAEKNARDAMTELEFRKQEIALALRGRSD